MPGSKLGISTAQNDKASGGIALIPSDVAQAQDNPLVSPEAKVSCYIDWDRRHNLMRMHTACHILSVLCPYPITSANVGESESRVDFDMPELPGSKLEITI